MQPINGREIAKKIREELKDEIARLGFRPGLGVLLVGDDPASHLYVSLKEKASRQAGLEFVKVLLPAEATEGEVLAKIDEFNTDNRIDGFIIQLPLPKHLNSDRVISAMLPSKDADGFHSENLSRLIGGQPRIYPVLPSAILDLLRATEVSLEGKTALVVSNSQIFYEPLEPMLRRLGLNPSWSEARDPKLNLRTRQADVVIVAAGRPELIDGRWLKDGAIVIDIGITRQTDGTIVGDVSQDGLDENGGWITPVPGGVGPVTVARLLGNVVELARQHRK